MELTEEQNRKISNALHLGEGLIIVCPICQGIDWSINPSIFEYPDCQDAKNRSSPPRRVFPVIILSCDSCSYCISFSAGGLGLITADQINNREHVEKNIERRFWEDMPFIKWLISGTRQDRMNLLIGGALIFIGGLVVGSNIDYSVIANMVSMVGLSGSIGWYLTLLGGLFLGLSAYLIDRGSRNPMIDVNEFGSISMTTSTKRTDAFNRNKMIHKCGIYTLIIGIVFSVAGLVITSPI